MKNGRIFAMSGLLPLILASLAMNDPNRRVVAAEQVPLATLNLGLDPTPQTLPHANHSATGKPLMIKGK